jgi:hypothetical protein
MDLNAAGIFTTMHDAVIASTGEAENGCFCTADDGVDYVYKSTERLNGHGQIRLGLNGLNGPIHSNFDQVLSQTVLINLSYTPDRISLFLNERSSLSVSP